MKRLALVLALCACAQAQRHPAIAIGIVGAVVSGLACEMDTPAHQSTCGIIMAAAGGGLGVITGIATLIANTNETSVTSGDDDMEMEGGAVRVHSHTAPPPVPLDAGVVVDSAPVPPAVVDSGGPVDGAEVKAGSNQ
jgi:hypothetical protein